MRSVSPNQGRSERANLDRRLARELEEAGEDSRWTRAFLQASADESRHEELCARFAMRGGVGVPAGAEPHGSVAPAELTRADALLYDIVATCCVAETINAALLTAELATADEPALAALTTQLLREEVQHARLGWTYLGEVVSRRNVGVLTPYLGEMLGLGSLEGVEPSPQVLTRGRSQQVLRETLKEVVLPGLAVHGLRAGPNALKF